MASNLQVVCTLNHNGNEYVLGIDMTESFTNKTLKEVEFEKLFKALQFSVYRKLQELNVFII